MKKYSDECIALAKIIHSLTWKEKNELVKKLIYLQETKDTANKEEPPVFSQERVL